MSLKAGEQEEIGFPAPERAASNFSSSSLVSLFLDASLHGYSHMRRLFLMQQADLIYKSSRIHFAYTGNGKELIFCFHGYGESAGSFALLSKFLRPGMAAAMIDLPFHGQTEWKEGLDFDPDDLLAIMDQVGKLHFPAAETFHLMGYSMGARLALSIYQLQPSRFRKLLLLAPDGFKVNRWYWLATQSYLGNRLFRFTMKNPEWFKGILRVGQSLRLVNQSIFKFTRYYIKDETIRNELYQRWTCMRHFRPDISVVKSQVMAHHTSVYLFYGRYDRIIRFEAGDAFREGIEAYCSLLILDCGHQVLHEKNAQTLAKPLQS